MTSSYRAPVHDASAELREKASRFLAIVSPLGSPSEAKARVADLEQRHRDATHVCWAWRLGAPPDARERCTDAGEPSGTAGRPILRALRGFEAHVAGFAEAGVPFWVCPGTSSWNSLIGRLDNARGNLLDAAQVGLARGASGYLITDWGDNGHMQPPSVSWPARGPPGGWPPSVRK